MLHLLFTEGFFCLFSRLGCLNNNIYQRHLIEDGGLVGLGLFVLVWFFCGTGDGGLVFFSKRIKLVFWPLVLPFFRCMNHSSCDTRAFIELNWDFPAREDTDVQGSDHNLFFQFSSKIF